MALGDVRIFESGSETDIVFYSRGMKVPATVTLPGEGSQFPLVVMCHGHADNRHEHGGFTAIARALASRGIASIRMDYAGCGDSEEDFGVNCLSVMEEDTRQARMFALASYSLDPERVGILGYSMGGRIALDLLADGREVWRAAVLLAPAADQEDVMRYLGGEDVWEHYLNKAEQSEEQVVVVHLFGEDERLGRKWFTDQDRGSCEDLLMRAGKGLKGNALVIYAVDDVVVNPAVSQKTADALHAKAVRLPANGHACGMRGGYPKILDIVVNETAQFMTAEL